MQGDGGSNANGEKYIVATKPGVYRAGDVPAFSASMALKGALIRTPGRGAGDARQLAKATTAQALSLGQTATWIQKVV
jgi:hypothetical protein